MNILTLVPYFSIAAIGYFLGYIGAKLVIKDEKRKTDPLIFVAIILVLFGCIYLAFYLDVTTTLFWACGLIPFMAGLLKKVIGHNEKKS